MFSNTDFDINKAREAAKLFHGNHDFRTFMGLNPQNKERVIIKFTLIFSIYCFKYNLLITQDHASFTRRSISHISIDAAQPVCNPSNAERANSIYDFWNISMTGRSFVYRQVRRMVGVILAVSFGRLQLRDAYEMLTIPSANSWCPTASAAPAFGLYLTKVAYNEDDKKWPTQ